jgi:hypothetical protein
VERFWQASLSDIVKTRAWRPHLAVLRWFCLRQFKRMFYKTAIKWIKSVEAKGMVVSRDALASIREGLYRVTQARCLFPGKVTWKMSGPYLFLPSFSCVR